ncbi:MAG: hypothetical protein CME46_05035 [Halieaceae bacterium]|jgi:hypothetical protein|nr:hypothetical protein [Halieaceae bacterium]|tara:strand:+ start:4528 stop:4905 length:378 start_codon:yes stop_codon:yes gene_type:complete
MNTAIRLLVLLCGILFLVTGLRWLLAPAGVAPEFGLVLGSGVGLSSQVGDMSAFFLTLGVCILMGLTTQRTLWYFPPIILLSLTAVGRILAWLLHDAALATNLIAPEIIVALILLTASRRLPAQG